MAPKPFTNHGSDAGKYDFATYFGWKSTQSKMLDPTGHLIISRASPLT